MVDSHVVIVAAHPSIRIQFDDRVIQFLVRIHDRAGTAHPPRVGGFHRIPGITTMPGGDGNLAALLVVASGGNGAQLIITDVYRGGWAIQGIALPAR